ncbi:hypothetical protein Goshw_016140 [Gossypium schwendimanii]|uniref:Uncharacterized protein n=1 Tax=Gossypium schwendimanii TaxID=34291 RepID=A0A7J9KSP7_GOSSC|nr:hypothetical protein [Gossypium schwendimanii]
MTFTMKLDFFFSIHRFRGMNWVQRKIFLYNVTFGLYMLDWWERCLFSILFFCFSCLKRSNLSQDLHTSKVVEFLNHGRYFGHCVDVVHLLQQLTICNCVLEGVKSLALLSGTIH